MLIKLFKHEFKATARVFLPLYGLLIVFSLLNKYVTSNIIRDSVFTGILIVIPSLLYGCIIVGVLAMSAVMLFQRFSKNLLGDEGYLMHTLPVRASGHILCKLVVSSFWVIISSGLVFLSVLFMAADVKDWGSLLTNIDRILGFVTKDMGMSNSTFIWGFLSFVFIATIEKTLMVYAGMGIGQRAAKSKVGMSILAIVIMNAAEQVLMSISLVVYSRVAGSDMVFHQAASGPEILHFIFWWYLGASIIFGTTYALICNRMLKRHLNLA